MANKYQRMDLDELADAPLEALGLASSDAAASSKPLASAPSASWPNTDSSAAQAIVNLAGPNQ